MYSNNIYDILIEKMYESNKKIKDINNYSKYNNSSMINSRNKNKFYKRKKFYKINRLKQIQNNLNNDFDEDGNIVKNKILCFNMLNSGTCSYSDKCLYAHSLEEQCIDVSKKTTIEIFKKKDLKDIDLIKDKELYNNLVILTKLCNECVNNTCPGGYNCKYGA